MTQNNQAWTVVLGKELQRLHAEGATDLELSRLEHNLSLAIQQVKFIRRCYNKNSATHTTEVN